MAFAGFSGGVPCSLSPRERAGVRGKEAKSRHDPDEIQIVN
jgi:hypothetical protein